MRIVSKEQAYRLLEHPDGDPFQREAAIHYLAHHPDEKSLEVLVQALQDDDFGVRWEASIMLSRLGRRAILALLAALTDPARAGDERLRRGAYRVLRHTRPSAIVVPMNRLIRALRGPAPDVVSMEEAYRLLQQLRVHEQM